MLINHIINKKETNTKETNTKKTNTKKRRTKAKKNKPFAIYGGKTRRNK